LFIKYCVYKLMSVEISIKIKVYLEAYTTLYNFSIIQIHYTITTI